MIGATRVYDEQVYTAVAVVPHECVDGRLTTLTKWRSACATCGDPFVTITPTRASKFQPNRRCQRCKRPGCRVQS